MKPRLLGNLLGCLFLLVVCVHICNGFSISREVSDTRVDSSKLQKKISPVHPPKKFKSPVVIEKKKISEKKKIKISELKPCISKAFCEVNSITETPTYETTKEFYLILNRLKKFTDTNDRDLNGSGSVEEDSGSSEESYEHEPYQPYNPHRSGPGGPYYSPFRRAKSLDVAKKLKKHKKVSVIDKLTNGTEIEAEAEKNATITKPVKVLSPAQIEKRAFVDRKTQELNVVDDLAALIKISAEIGQALKSPRRCRIIFRKCEMSYDQIIRIFNRTQAVEKSAALASKSVPPSTPEPSTTTVQQVLSSTTITPVSETEPTLSEDENFSGNRNKKSRTDFSDEDPEYVLDTEAESQPVKTYALFAPSASEQQSQNNQNQKRTDAIVDEAFMKFEKVFPSRNKYRKNVDDKKVKAPASSEEEASNESGSVEKAPPQYGGYQHRSSSENDAPDSEEVEMEVPPKKIKERPSIQSVAAEVDETEDDSDAEIASSEIGKKPKDAEQAETSPVEGESSEEGSEESQKIYQRDEEEYPYGNGGYTQAGVYRPPDQDKTGSKKNKRKKKGKKKDDPEDEESEEEQPDPIPPPPDSQFYHYIKQVNNGKGADTIPVKGKRKGSKTPPPSAYHEEVYGTQPEYYGNQGPEGYKPSNYGSYHQSPYDGPHSQSSGPPQERPSFFQSIVGWFSRSGKNSGGSTEQTSAVYGQGPQGQQYGAGAYSDVYGSKPQHSVSAAGSYGHNGYSSRPSASPAAYEDEEYVPSKRKTSSKHPPPQGRGEEESSEEAEEDEEEYEQAQQAQPTKREAPQRPPPNSHNAITVAGPPPPLVIVPPEEEANYPSPRTASKNDDSNKSNKKKEETSDEETREETSSEEVKKKRKEIVAKKPKNKNINSDGAFSGIFASAVEIDKQLHREKQKEDKENTSLLLSTFDSVTNSFSTSADKITDWSEEDNPKKKVKVVSLFNNGHKTNGKYKVTKNNKNKNQGINSYETREKEEKASSEEEDKK